MKAPAEIDAVFADTLRRLPKWMAPKAEHVTSPLKARDAGKLRVMYGHDLVAEYGHGVCGWIRIESGQGYNRAIGAVHRAMLAAMKAAP